MNNIKSTVEFIINWIQDYFKDSTCNAIVGISGGKDSSVVAALCVKALGKDRVIGVKMPQGNQHDIDSANKLISFLGIRSYEVNIKDACDSLYSSLELSGVELDSRVKTNTPARIRMSTLYAIAAVNHGRVANTCNLSEDYIGYSTKFGDSAGDFSPLSNYTVREVLSIGEYLCLPNDLIHKVPEDGMCGKSDEDNLGFSYSTLDDMLLLNIRPDNKIEQKIMDMHKRNLHKLFSMPTCPHVI